jgi:non-ribosomal peptide synthetase component F
VQYADYAVWQRGWLQGQTLERHLSYWKRQLGSTPPPLQLPADGARTAAGSTRGATERFALGAETSAALKALGLREGATLFMTLLAAFKALLSRYTGQDDIVVGTNIANRNRASVEGLIGFFVNNLVLRTDLSGDPTFRELLGRVRDTTLGAYAHQDVPFEVVVEALRPERGVSGTPFFQVMFVLQNVPTPTLSLEGLTLSAVEVESETSNFDLSLFMGETAGGLVGHLVYNTDLFARPTVARLAGRFRRLLDAVAAQPDCRLSLFPLDEAVGGGPAHDFGTPLEEM